MTTSEEFGAAVEYYMKRKELTQKALAAKVGISPNAMCTIIKGRSFPPCKTLNAICEALDVGIMIYPKI